MAAQKISALLALSLISSPVVSSRAEAPLRETSSSISPKPSFRASVRRMGYQLAAAPLLLEPSEPAYIRPPFAHHIDAPLPAVESSEEIVGIYGNILYPQDQEQLQQSKIFSWMEAYSKDPTAPFPLSPEEIKDISLYILDRLPVRTIHSYFAQRVQAYLIDGAPLEEALNKAKQETLHQVSLYGEIAKKIEGTPGRCEQLSQGLIACAHQAEQIIDRDAKAMRKASAETLQQLLTDETKDLIDPPYTWEMRRNVLRQMVDKVMSVSPNSPYFLALQEVTPQALHDLKQTLEDRDLQWISLNNISGKETLVPQQENILGEAGAFTSTIALSRDLEVLKVELGDLPTESGSVRKILGVRVRNTHTNETFNLFSTHTDHQIQNDIYARTAAKIHEFATRFFQDAPESTRFVIGGDLNVFKQLGGNEYVERLRELFPDSQDFRETDYYAPRPIAWSSFIGRPGDPFMAPIAEDGTVEASGLDQLLVGGGIELQSAGREALAYDESGHLLDYYSHREKYIESLKKRITFSDHIFNIIRIK